MDQSNNNKNKIASLNPKTGEVTEFQSLLKGLPPHECEIGVFDTPFCNLSVQNFLMTDS